MEIIRGTLTPALPEDMRTAVAIGKFDGVHVGHRKLLEVIGEKRAQGLVPCVFLLDPDPASYFAGAQQPCLTSEAEKLRIFEELGVELAVLYPLTAETAATPPERFIREILGDLLHTRFVACGTDVSYGHRGAGDAALMTRIGPSCGIEVRVVDKVRDGDHEISSTYIRERLADTPVSRVNELLGAPYPVEGRVDLPRGGDALGVSGCSAEEERSDLPRGGDASEESACSAEDGRSDLPRGGDVSEVSDCSAEEGVLLVPAGKILPPAGEYRGIAEDAALRGSEGTTVRLQIPDAPEDTERAVHWKTEDGSRPLRAATGALLIHITESI